MALYDDNVSQWFSHPFLLFVLARKWRVFLPCGHSRNTQWRARTFSLACKQSHIPFPPDGFLPAGSEQVSPFDFPELFKQATQEALGREKHFCQHKLCLPAVHSNKSHDRICLEWNQAASLQRRFSKYFNHALYSEKLSNALSELYKERPSNSAVQFKFKLLYYLNSHVV